jgi:hypothetical protein
MAEVYTDFVRAAKERLARNGAPRIADLSQRDLHQTDALSSHQRHLSSQLGEVPKLRGSLASILADE